LKEEASTSNDKIVQDLIQQLDHLKIFLAKKDFDYQKITADVTKEKNHRRIK